MAASPVEFVEIADTLYGLAPEQFTAARDAAAREARSAGNRSLADELKGLHRPSIAAWLVNQLVRRRSDQLDELLELGEALREAQAQLDREELRTMSRRRHEVVSALAEQARALVGEQRSLSESALREVATTLDAALADEGAAGAVRSGRLVRALSSTGLDAVDLSGAVAGPDAEPSPRRRKPSRPSRKAENGTAQGSASREATRRRELDQAVDDAQDSLDRAEHELTAREDEVSAARDATERARERVTELEEALQEARDARAAAEHARAAADRARSAAARTRDAARRELDTARNRRQELER
jgi:hypothetical protein